MDKILSNRTILQDNLDHTFFSWSKQGGLNPLLIERAKGVYLYDNSGKKYLDFSSMLMNVNIGHGHPKVLKAIQDQMGKLTYVAPSMATEIRGKLGRKLAEITPGSLSKTFFTLGGADAIENGIKFARIYSGRQKIVSLYRAFHGATYVALSAGGDPRKHPIDSQAAPNFVHVENPYFYRCPWGTDSPEACGEMAAAHMERVIQFENPNNIAAILIEGESGTSGCIKFPPTYLKQVKAIADKYGILLMVDEIMSGFGRTGKMFGVDYHGVEPDILCMAKGLTAGYLPLGGVIVSDKIAAHFDENVLPLGMTYSAHAVSCAAALAVIEVYEEENLLENAAKMSEYMVARMEELKLKHPSIGDFRTTGLLGCIELVRNRETKEPLTPWNARLEEMEPTRRIAAKIRELGMFTFVKWSWIFICPPLCITKEQIDEGLEIISKALEIADEYC